ncbi:hypothetical protein [Halorhabdus amylolytica]|uniref:hypothetical protein n=1 Tax=Halorhabdus amylolytica TaxID=2559573 RepID=UPI0010A9ED06|nr:hypothetical protein [Halorhabdus amylolytica]
MFLALCLRLVIAITNFERGDDPGREKLKRIDSEYKSILQSDACKAETNFIFDLEGASAETAAAFAQRLREHKTISLRRETPNGFPRRTDPFDYSTLSTDVEYELKTDDMVFVDFIGE